jgi:hypothetical protein
MSNPAQLVSKLWNYYSILHDDGLSNGDLVSQARHDLVPHSGRVLRAKWPSSKVFSGSRHE